MNENESENQTVNPYAAPATAVITAKRDDTETAFIAYGKSVSAGNGATWMGEAWELFKKNPGIFIACFIIQIVIYAVLAFIPLLGSLLTALIGPIFAAGWIVMAHAARNDDSVEVGQLFAGLQNKAGELFTLGAINLGLGILFVIVLGVLGFAVFGTALLGLISAGGDTGKLSSLVSGGSLLMFLVFFLIVFIGSFLLYGALWFAPALVMQHNVAPLEAIKQSFLAFMKNWLAFVVLGLIFIGLCIASIFTLGFAMLVVFPLMFLSTYSSYRDVFTDGQ